MRTAVLNGAIEIGDVKAVVVFRIRDRSRDDAARKRDVRSVGTRSTRACDQSVFACVTWADDQHETSRANEICWGCRRRGQSRHARRFPPHHTLRTAAAGLMDTNGIGAFAGRDFAPIRQADNVRWCLAHGANG